MSDPDMLLCCAERLHRRLEREASIDARPFAEAPAPYRDLLVDLAEQVLIGRREHMQRTRAAMNEPGEEGGADA